jgi:hypothetical protein
MLLTKNTVTLQNVTAKMLPSDLPDPVWTNVLKIFSTVLLEADHSRNFNYKRLQQHTFDPFIPVQMKRETIAYR